MEIKRKNIILKVINWVFKEKTLRLEGFPISRTEMAPRDQ
jgi:hypothetical protein